MAGHGCQGLVLHQVLAGAEPHGYPVRAAVVPQSVGETRNAKTC